MRLTISLLLTTMMSTAVHAEVMKSTDDAFIIGHSATVAGDMAMVFEAMTSRVGNWWNPDHSFSGDANNMQIDTSCFCERWDGNLVRHLNTVIWIENSKVVMEGGLGPLKELGLNGTMIWSLATSDDGGTTVNWKYHVYGYSETDMKALSAAVDGVLGEQIGCLVEYLE
jgi:hypothetical protein